MNTPKDEQKDLQDPGKSSEARRLAASTLEELLLCATEYERRAGASTDPEEWFRAESESLLQWAKDREMLLSDAEFGELIAGFKLLNGGLEHQVFWKRKTGRIFKITKPPYFGAKWTLKSYVQNAIWCNQAFYDDIRLEGVIQTRDGVSLVMSQPFIVGSSPTKEEIADWFTQQGAVQLTPLIWEFPDGLVAGDAHSGNLILMNDGTMVPIDLHVEKMPANALGH